MKGLRKWPVLGLLSLLCASATVVAYALPANEIETLYFEDAAFGSEAGGTILSCQGGTYRWGRRTRYAAKYSTPCNTAGIAEVACLVNGIETTCPINICDSTLFTC